MDHDMIARHLENLDRRLAKVEQFLPTLATKEELQAAIAPLATKGELQAAIALTKEELHLGLATQSADLRREIREEGERSRRHMDVVSESLRGDIQLLAEHLSVVMSRLTDK